jgi:phosphoserine/homoserine phosphotransferase
MAQLGWPTILCHTLRVVDGRIAGWRPRLADQKRASVAAFQALGYSVAAVGDSYNDTGMLTSAEVGVFFRPPAAVVRQFPDLPVAAGYDELRLAMTAARARVDAESRE